MKFTYFLGILAYGLCLEGRRIPATGVAARQWGEGEDGEEEEEGSDGGRGEEDACNWTGHCLGDPCETELDCDGDLTCGAGTCADPDVVPPTVTVGIPTPIIVTTTIYVTAMPTAPPNPDCEWTGHCAGDPCRTESDCDGDMACHSGTCGDGPITQVTSTRRIVTSTRRMTVPLRPTTTRRVTIPLTYTRSTVRPQPTSAQANPRPPCVDNPLACIGNSCEADADCGGSLIICKSGICGL